MENDIKLNLTNPAPKEIIVLATGISLVTKTPLLPYLLMYELALSIVPCDFGNFLLSHFIVGVPKKEPKKYKIQLPSKPAITDIISVKMKLTSVLATKSPAAGIIIPEGSPGRFKYSKNTIINKTIDPYSTKKSTKVFIFSIKISKFIVTIKKIVFLYYIAHALKKQLYLIIL